MRGPCAYVLRWARPYKGQRIRGLVYAIFVASFRSAQKRVQKRVFLGGAYYWTTPPALPASSRMMRMMLCMLAM